MISEAFTFIFALMGILFLFHTVIFKITLWLTEDFTVAIPLYEDDDLIFDRVYKLHSLLDFCGLRKKCTIVIINYGASENYICNLQSYYSQYKRLRITNACDLPEGIKG
jgi:hypothetical protein